ncbi:MAG: hypothetical protein QOE70_5766 [Chthoniobacter sp.]|jgi:hypothetical protein|nr:hypothetical protein [Chthoniobacter sp.]
MKFLNLSLRAALWLTALPVTLICSAFAGTAVTVPAGYSIFAPAPSLDGTTRAFTVASFPLQGATKWNGIVSAPPGTNTVIGKGANWGSFGPAADGFPTHYLRFVTGTAAGRTFAIAGNTANTATVVLPSTVTSLGTAVQAGDGFEILPVNTLKGVFGATAATVKFAQNAVQDLADIVYVWNQTSWIAYWFDGSRWIGQFDEFSDSGNTPIFNDEAVWVSRRSTGTIAYVLTGTVPSVSTVALEVPGTTTADRRFTLLSNPFPTSTTLGNLKLESLGNWQKNAVSDLADIAYLWNGAAWIAYWHNGTQWVSQYDEFSDAAGTAIPLGSGVWVARRSASGAGGSTYTSVARPYSL